MPRRLITSEIWTNEKFGRLDKIGRLLFIGLITNADDDGRIKGSPNFLKAKIFPYDNDVNAEDIDKCLDICHTNKLIARYSVNGDSFISLLGWNEHQQIRVDRRKPSLIPPPTDNHLTTNGIPPDNHLTTNGIRNIIEDNIIEDNIIDRFEIFWEHYPRKVAKQKALKSFKKISPDDKLFQKMLNAVEEYKNTKQWQNKEFIPHPTTWLNQCRWEDEIIIAMSDNKPDRYNLPTEEELKKSWE